MAECVEGSAMSCTVECNASFSPQRGGQTSISIACTNSEMSMASGMRTLEALSLPVSLSLYLSLSLSLSLSLALSRCLSLSGTHTLSLTHTHTHAHTLTHTHSLVGVAQPVEEQEPSRAR